MSVLDSARHKDVFDAKYKPSVIFQVFCIICVLGKLATSSIRINNAIYMYLMLNTNLQLFCRFFVSFVFWPN